MSIPLRPHANKYRVNNIIYLFKISSGVITASCSFSKSSISLIPEKTFVIFKHCTIFQIPGYNSCIIVFKIIYQIIKWIIFRNHNTPIIYRKNQPKYYTHKNIKTNNDKIVINVHLQYQWTIKVNVLLL